MTSNMESVLLQIKELKDKTSMCNLVSMKLLKKCMNEHCFAFQVCGTVNFTCTLTALLLLMVL